MGLGVAFGKCSKSENRLTIKMPLQPKPERQPPDSVMCLDCTVCRCLTRLTRTRARPSTTQGTRRPCARTPACIHSHRHAQARAQRTHARAHGEGKDGSVGVEHIAPKAPPTEHTGGQGPRGLSLLAPLALPSSPLILPSCLLSGWGPGAHFNGSVAWGFSLVSHYPPGWGCHGPETKGQHAGNRTAKTFWGQRKDNSLFWERLM